jgi:radical SAM superfamily enzyme YgiQ (UPF0313 family)
MNTLLISVQKDLDAVGLKYLHGYLLNNNHKSSMFYVPDFNLQDTKQQQSIREFVSQINPGLIGFSLMSGEYHATRYLTNFIKSFTKSTPIIWGGIHPTVLPESCLEHADYACIGEGEQTILDIANAIKNNGKIKDINNLCFLEDGRIKKNPLYPLIEDLDKIPSYERIPANSFILVNRRVQRLDKKIYSKYARWLGRTYSIITTRGCPFSCTYCGNNFISHLYPLRKIRRRNINGIIDELKKALRDYPEIEYVNFQDDCFLGCSDDYLEQFCNIYKEQIRKPFIVKSIPIYITEDRLKSLKNAGLSWITLGLQSGSDRVCTEIYKRKSLKADFLKATKLINKYKIAAFYDVILDNPFETTEDKLETIDVLMKTPRPFYLQLFSLVFFYGTELYDKAKSEQPQCLEDCTKKDFLIPQRNTLNILTKLASLIKEKYMLRIM